MLHRGAIAVGATPGGSCRRSGMRCLSRSWRSPLDSQARSRSGGCRWRLRGFMRALRQTRAYRRPQWNASLSVGAFETLLSLAATMCFVSVTAAAAEPNTCEVPNDLTKNGKALCVRAASILLPQPRLTPVQIANGPDFDALHPDRSRFAYFTDADTISCYFRPRYAFDRVKS